MLFLRILTTPTRSKRSSQPLNSPQSMACAMSYLKIQTVNPQTIRGPVKNEIKIGSKKFLQLLWKFKHYCDLTITMLNRPLPSSFRC